jgi:hypothetical protein
MDDDDEARATYSISWKLARGLWTHASISIISPGRFISSTPCVHVSSLGTHAFNSTHHHSPTSSDRAEIELLAILAPRFKWPIRVVGLFPGIYS